MADDLGGPSRSGAAADARPLIGPVGVVSPRKEPRGVAPPTGRPNPVPASHARTSPADLSMGVFYLGTFDALERARVADRTDLGAAPGSARGWTLHEPPRLPRVGRTFRLWVRRPGAP